MPFSNSNGVGQIYLVYDYWKDIVQACFDHNITFESGGKFIRHNENSYHIDDTISYPTTICLNGLRFSISDINEVSDNCSYAISGAPIMINGDDVSYSQEVIGEQDWDGSFVYDTWHGALCLTSSKNKAIYVGIRTFQANCLSSSEIFDKLNSLNLGITDAILLDGGGSFVLEHGNTLLNSGTRRVNNIITF